jgi:hypothetical protein
VNGGSRGRAVREESVLRHDEYDLTRETEQIDRRWDRARWWSQRPVDQQLSRSRSRIVRSDRPREMMAKRAETGCRRGMREMEVVRCRSEFAALGLGFGPSQSWGKSSGQPQSKVGQG